MTEDHRPNVSESRGVPGRKVKSESRVGLTLVPTQGDVLASATADANRRVVFAERLRRIADLRGAGLDPDVDLAFIVAYVGESRATIYGKVARGDLPKPVKRGRSSFWPLSVVDAYKKGGQQ
jgi:predicted DNA-binding transcriptional regulator AlpA